MPKNAIRISINQTSVALAALKLFFAAAILLRIIENLERALTEILQSFLVSVACL